MGLEAKIRKRLFQYKMYKVNIVNAKEQLEFIENNISVKGLSYDGQPSGSNMGGSGVENDALFRIEQKDKLKERIAKNELLVNAIDRTLGELLEYEEKVLRYKYIDKLNWYEVAQELKISIRHCKRIEGDAMEKMVTGLF